MKVKSALLSLILAISMLVPASVQAQTGTGQVTIVNGLTTPEVDVYVNNSLTARKLPFGATSAPVTIASGTHGFAVYAASGSAPALAQDRADAPLVTTSRQVVDGSREALVIHGTTAAASVTFAAVSSCQVGSTGALVAVRHLAEAGTLSVKSDSGVEFGTIAAGQRAQVQALAGQGLIVTVQISDASGAFPATTLPKLNIPAGTQVIFYAVGSGVLFDVVTANTCASVSPESDDADDDELVRLGRFDDPGMLAPAFTG